MMTPFGAELRCVVCSVRASVTKRINKKPEFLLDVSKDERGGAVADARGVEPVQG